MSDSASKHPDELDRLRRASGGDRQLLAELFEGQRERLRRLVKLRLHGRLQSRLDASDIIQDAYLQAAAELPRYLHNPKMPFGLWLRTIALQKLTELHRRHLGVQARDASREVSLYVGPTPQASSAALAAQLIGQLTSASEAAVRAELKLRVQEALNEMDALDREVLALRHFEQLSNQEVSQVLGISERAASNRHVRALLRLKTVLKGLDAAP